jgi:hypothetical protein
VIDGSHLTTAFGLDWRSDIALAHFDCADSRAVGRPIVEVRGVPTLGERTVVRSINRGEVCHDGVRFGWRDEAVFDMINGRRIDYLPGRGWPGAMPIAFFSTLAALTLAWRGAIPIHATTVAIDGKALLIAGPPGAGKSTTAAALIAHGARLVSDDLSVIDPFSSDGTVTVRRGRPEMRLHPETACRLELAQSPRTASHARGKQLVRPLARCEDNAVPLAAIILLGGGPGVIDPIAAAARMPAHLFRPRWLAAMPGHGARIAAMMSLPTRAAIGGLLALEPKAAGDLDARAGETFTLFERLAGS